MRRVLFAIIFIAGDTSAQVLVEDFSSLSLTENIVAQGAPLICATGVPANNLTFAPNAWSNKWAFHSSGAYPISWSGFNATQSWAVAGNQMYFHAVKGPLDDGHAIISRDTFDRGRYIIASADIRAYCSNGSAGLRPSGAGYPERVYVPVNSASRRIVARTGRRPDRVCPS